MRKFLPAVQIFLILCFVSISSVSHGQNTFTKDSLQKKLAQMKEQTHVRTLIAGIWLGEKELITTAMGESMTNVPATVDMHFRIGGVSEMFLGTLLMILVDEGKISLDDKISKWLPDLLMADKVTPGMLIKNTAGYKDYVLDTNFQNMIINAPFTSMSRKEIIDYSIRGGEMNFPPGTEFRYSHTEFTILGEVIERATGRTMKELHEEYLFKPLGLENTGYSTTAELPFPVLHSFSSDRGIYEDATYWNPTWTGDSGPLYSSLHDLGKWAKIFGKGKLLSPGSFEKLVSAPAGIGKADFHFASGFGVSNGWYIQNPSFNGFSGAFAYMPSKDLTVIVYSTQSEDPNSNAQSIKMLKELVKMLTPENALNF